MMTDELADFFISYAGEDRDWAVWIAFQLELDEYKVTVQEWDFAPGSNFMRKIDSATKSTKHTLALLSADYLRKEYPLMEFFSALRSDPLSDRGRLIPIKIKSCSLEGLLANIVYIDLVGINEEQAVSKLLSGVRHATGGQRWKPKSQPPFPGGGGGVEQPRPRFPPPKESANFNSAKRSRFLHSQVMSSDWLDYKAVGIPYFVDMDPTDSDIDEVVPKVDVVFWIPSEEHFHRDGSKPFTPAVAVCSSNLSGFVQKVRNAVGDKIFEKLDFAPSKIFNEERSALFRAVGCSMHQSFVACIGIPEVLLASGKNNPTLGFQTIADLLFAPVLACHGVRGACEVSVHVVGVGRKTPFVVGQLKKIFKAVLKSGPICVDVATDSDGSEVWHAVKIARLLSWATSRAYNHADDKWISLVDGGLKESEDAFH